MLSCYCPQGKDGFIPITALRAACGLRSFCWIVKQIERRTQAGKRGYVTTQGALACLACLRACVKATINWVLDARLKRFQGKRPGYSALTVGIRNIRRFDGTLKNFGKVI